MKFKSYDLIWFICYGMTIFIMMLALFSLEGYENKVICMTIAFGVMSFLALVTMSARTLWMNRYDKLHMRMKRSR